MTELTAQSYVQDFPSVSSSEFRRAAIVDRVVHIIESDLPTCEALSVLFRLEGFQTRFTSKIAESINALERYRVDVAIVGLEVEGESGLGLLRRIKALYAGAPVIMLSGKEPNLDAAVTAMKLGAVDVLSRPVDGEHLMGVIMTALRRNVRVGAMQDGRREIVVRGFSQLTPRERQVLQLIVDGLSNKEAGRELGISPRTVEVHRARVMEKMGAKNTADLIRIVLTS